MNADDVGPFWDKLFYLRLHPAMEDPLNYSIKGVGWYEIK
jgi:hypothetical protein